MGLLFKDHHRRHSPRCLSAKLISRAIYLLLPFLLLHFYFFSRPISLSTSPPTNTNTNTITTTNNKSTSTPSPLPQPSCDYSKGKWIPSSAPLLYNGSSCTTIKDAQNCMTHGRPDTTYLHYRWRPSSCRLPRFKPTTLLRLLRHKHLAFVGDSMARNQLESLLCLLSSHSPPTLLFSDGDQNKNRRWRFDSHNLTVSVFWSPFLVKGVEKSPEKGLDYNKLYIDAVDERWAGEVTVADVIVLSAGHWFLHRAVYYESQAVNVGCHSCPGLNCTEVGFYEIFRKSFRTALAEVVGRRRLVGSPALAVVTTFSPAHFEGEWDKVGACARTEPYGDVEVGAMEREMWQRQVEEVETSRRGEGLVRVEALDVTRMAAMRPDGHPGPYMYAFPFRNGVPERMPNDCVHWCMPGPIDAWNEVFLQMVKRWQRELGAEGRG